VPDPAENEFRLNGPRTDLSRDDLVYSINEWDNYAVEEALQITSRLGGEVTVITAGGEDDEEILRRQLAMGAQRAVLVSDEAFVETDARGIAMALAAYAKKNHFDLILTGVQAESGGAQVGGMMAAMLDLPFASLVTSIEALEGNKLKVAREVAGGNKEISEMDLPCVLSIQTGINEPRYVGMRGIRQVASVEIPSMDVGALGIAAAELQPKVERAGYFTPVSGTGAEMLSGDRDDIVNELVERLKARGGIPA
jgi:electron transfer flavoprotein beta subunit